MRIDRALLAVNLINLNEQTLHSQCTLEYSSRETISFPFVCYECIEFQVYDFLNSFRMHTFQNYNERQ